MAELGVPVAPVRVDTHGVEAVPRGGDDAELTRLAQDFNDSDVEVGGECAFARVQSKSSGGAAQLLADGWDESQEGPRPVIWSPAAST